jgi:hypothetical protein
MWLLLNASMPSRVSFWPKKSTGVVALASVVPANTLSQAAYDALSAATRSARVVFFSLDWSAFALPVAATPQIRLLPSAMWPSNAPRLLTSGVGLKP